MKDNHRVSSSRKDVSKRIFELVLFAMLGALMFASKMIMEVLPNIHLLGMFVMVFTIVFRKRALIPIYIYIFLNGICAGFQPWWFPYLYIWTILWAITMLLPKNMPEKVAMVVCPVICALYGLAFGTLYAPGQAIIYGLNFKQTIAWIIKGLPYDVLHAVGNCLAGLLIVPLSDLLKKLLRR